jgi:hypothetical protein
MRKGLAIAVLFAAVLALTNPSQAEYVEWLEESFFEEEGGPSILVRLIGTPLVIAATEARSCGLFTVFKTGERVTVGVLGRFVAVR